jgi:SAM-dependent methyltransferase
MSVTATDPDALKRLLPEGCAVCGAADFAYGPVLWPSLIDEWELAPGEVDYINLQQGLHCRVCGSNLRSMVLALSLCRALGHGGTLDGYLASPPSHSLRVLEINEAGMLTNRLARLPGHTLVVYPEVNIHALPFAAGSFDAVVHSDTLEHVQNPVHALSECRRILRPGGVLAFTAPVVVGRMTRSRVGLPLSHHGDPAEERADYVVQTEFGADIWTCVIEAGFPSVTIETLLYPASLCFVARTA